MPTADDIDWDSLGTTPKAASSADDIDWDSLGTSSSTPVEATPAMEGTSMGVPEGMKYSPEQMATLDANRRKILNEELQTAQAKGDIENQQLLAKEISYNKDSLGPQVKPVVNSADGIDWDNLGTTKESTATPDTGAFVSNALMKTAAAFPATALKIAGGVTGALVNERLGDTIMGAGDAITKAASTSFGITPEMEQQARFDQKLAAAMGQGGLMMPLYANPITLTAAVTIPSFDRAFELIRTANIDSSAAGSIFMQALGANAAGAYVNTMFPAKVAGEALKTTVKKYAATGVATGVTNAATGAVEDWSSQKILEKKYPDLAKTFQPGNLEQRAIEAIAGGVPALGAKYFYDKSGKTAYSKQNENLYNRDKTFHPEVVDHAKDSLLDGTTPVGKDLGVTLAAIENSIVQPFSSYNHRDPTKTVPLLDYIATFKNSADINKIPGETEDLIRTLDALTAIGHETLVDTRVVIHDASTNTGEMVHSMDPNDYNKNIYTVIIPKITDRNAVQTLVHEVGHVLTNNFIRRFELIRDKHMAMPTDPRIQELYRRWEVLDKSFEAARTKAGPELYDRIKIYDPALAIDLVKNNLFDSQGNVASWGALHQTMTSPTFKNKYGFIKDLYAMLNIKEFISTAFERWHSRDLADPHRRLRGAEGMGKFTKDEVGAVSNMWDPVNYKAFDPLFKEAQDFLGSISDNKFVKVFYDNVFEQITGQQKVRTDPNEMLDRARLQNAYERHLIADVDDILKNKSSNEEALAALRVLHTTPEWKIFIAQHGETLIANATNISVRAEQARAVTNELAKGSLGRTEDIETFDELISKPEFHQKFDDIPNTLSRWVFGPDQARLTKLPPQAGKILRWVFRQMQKYNEMEAKLFQDGMQHLESLVALSTKDQKKVIDFAVFVDQSTAMRNEMRQQGIWWPDEAMIRKYKNLYQDLGYVGDKEIKAYLDIGHLEDKAYNLLKATALKQGEIAPERIPGHFPHMWKGDYKVLIVKKQPDGKEWITHVRAFTFRQQAEKYAKAVDAGALGQDFSTQRSDTGKLYHMAKMRDFEAGILPTMMQDVDAYRNFTLLDPEAQARISRFDEQHITGFNSHLLDRSGAHGWEGEMDRKYTNVDKLLGVRYRDTRDLLNTYENYYKRVVETFKNTMYVSDVHHKLFSGPLDPVTDKRPTFKNVMARLPNLTNHIFNVGANYTGMANNKLRLFDETFVNLMEKSGLPPHTYRMVAKNIRNLMSIVFTRYNPGNWVMNYIQPQHTYSIVGFIDSQRRIDGLSHYNVEKVMQEVMSGKALEWTDSYVALAWARENHILDAQAEYQMRSKATTKTGKVLETLSLGKVPTKIEANAREMSYLIAYTYFNKVLKDPVIARQSAAEVMGMTMVNYDRSRRPLMYQSFGVVGELLSPFAVYRNAWAGNTFMMVKHALQNPKQFHAWKPFLISQAMYMLTAGAIGAIGISEYDALLRLLKQFAPETFGTWPDAYAMMMKMGIPEVLRMGMLAGSSNAVPGLYHGAAIQGSGGAVGADDMLDPNLAPFAQAIGRTMALLPSYAMGRTPTSSQKYEALVGLVPGQGKYLLDKYFQPEGGNASFNAGKLVGSTEMDAGDEVSQAFMGKPSKKTYTERVEIRHAKAVDQTQIYEVKRMVELAVDAWDKTNNLDMDDLYASAFEKYGVTHSEFTEMIMNKRLERQLPYIEKLLKGEESFAKRSKLEALDKLGSQRQ